MGKRSNKFIGAGGGSILSGVWGVWSWLTAAKDLPKDAGEFAKMMADPPIYAPWLLFAACVIFLCWVFWDRNDDIDDGGNIKQKTHGPFSPTFNVGNNSTVSLHFDIKGDSNMPNRDEEIIRHLLERQGSVGHTVTSHNQSGGITAGEVNLFTEDASLKRQLRNLLAAADSRIPFELDRGNLEVETRMTAAQFERLNQIAQTNGSAAIIQKADVTGRFVGSTINNGTFGPKTAEAEQIRVKFQFKREIME